MKSIIVAFALIFFVNLTIAGPVPGTSVNINPPPGFVKADRFHGFMNESNGSSIMVSEIPGPYAETTRGFLDEEKLQAQGMYLIERSSITVDGRVAMLLHVEQSAYGSQFRKWVLAVDHSGSTTLIVASYLSGESKQQEQLLKKAVLSATFGKQTDPMDALSFNVKPQAPFEIAKVMGQNVLLSPNGQFPVNDKSTPIMIVGISASEGLIIEDRKEFAKRRVTQTPTIKNIIIQQSIPTTIGLLNGYSTLAEGKSEDTSMPMTVYQVILFDSSGYCIIQGVTPSANKEEYLPIFKTIAKSFRMKSQSSKAAGTYVTERTQKSDSQLSQLIIGKWKYERREGGLEVKGTSTYTTAGKVMIKAKMRVADRKINIDAEGNWFIENGILVTTVTKTNIPEIMPNGSILKDTIIKLDNKIFKYSNEKGEVTTEFKVSS